MLDESFVELMSSMTVLFERNKNLELDQRQRPKRFVMSNGNKIKLKEMNAVLTNFMESRENITITDLNTSYYTAAIILAGAVTPHNQNRTNHTGP